MTIQDIGAIGELVGAIAVVVSLVYLASQIRQNTRQIDQNTRAAQATAFDSAITQAMVARQALFEDADVAAIYYRGCRDPEALSDEERDRFRLMAHNILFAVWNLMSQAHMGGQAEEMLDAQLPLLRRMMTAPGIRWFWAHWSEEFGPSFRAQVEEIIAEVDAASKR